MSWKPLPAESYGSLAQRIHDGLSNGTYHYDCPDCDTCVCEAKGPLHPFTDGEITSETKLIDPWLEPDAGGPNYCSQNTHFSKCPFFKEDPQKLAAAVLERLKNPPPLITGSFGGWGSSISGLVVTLQSGMVTLQPGMVVCLSGSPVVVQSGITTGQPAKRWDGKQWV